MAVIYVLKKLQNPNHPSIHPVTNLHLPNLMQYRGLVTASPCGQILLPEIAFCYLLYSHSNFSSFMLTNYRRTAIGYTNFYTAVAKYKHNRLKKFWQQIIDFSSGQIFWWIFFIQPNS